MTNPIQPLSLDDSGVMRFKANKIVEHLLDWSSSRGMSLNDLARIDFSADDWQQFAQLIGYSLSGYGDLSYVDDQSYDAAEAMSKDPGINDLTARVDALQTVLSNIREEMRGPVAAIYGIHHDDLA